MTTVTIHKGFYRKTPVKNVTFPMIHDFKRTPTGAHITVDGTVAFGQKTCRIKVKSSTDYTVTRDNMEMVSHDAPVVEENTVETDEQVMERINERFQILNELTAEAVSGNIRSMFVCGAPGVGKTFGVQQTLNAQKFMDVMNEDGDNYTRFGFISGHMTPIHLYMQLHEYSEEGNVLVIDDCDDVFNDEDALNILKTALDTKKKRTIHWNAASATLKKADIGNSFEYKGSVIFITNKDFKKMKPESNMAAHMTALMSRSHFLDLTVHTDREKMLRIEDMVWKRDMLTNLGIEKVMQVKIMDFIKKNAAKFNELSLRTVVKLVDLVKAFESDDRWINVAKISLLGNRIGG